MDVSKETNLEKLKAKAYDLVVEMQNIQSNIQDVNKRIAEIQTESVEPETK